VLDWDEAVAHPHNLARGTFERVEGAVHPSAAPRFSRSVVETRAQPQAASIEEILASWDAR
jgi:alpha-methylacyl-CoA racemase